MPQPYYKPSPRGLPQPETRLHARSPRNNSCLIRTPLLKNETTVPYRYLNTNRGPLIMGAILLGPPFNISV